VRSGRAATSLTILLAGLLLGAPAPARAAPPPLRGLAVDESLQGEAVLAEALNSAGLRAQGLPVFARVRATRSELEPVPGELRLQALDARLERYQTKGVPVLVALAGPLPGLQEIDAWRHFLRGLVERHRGRVVGYELADPPPTSPSAIPDLAFAIKRTAVEIRATDPDALVLLALPPADATAFLTRLYGEDIAAYLDGLVLSATAEDRPPLLSLVEREDPTAVVVVAGLVLEADPAAAAGRVLESQLGRLGGPVALEAYSGDVPAVATALRAVDQVKDVMTSEVVRLEDEAARLGLLLAEQDVTKSLPHLLLYNLDNFSTYLVYRAPAGERGPLSVSLGDPTGRQPILRDALGATTKPVPGFVWDKAGQVTRLRVPLQERPQVVEFRYADAAPAARTEVSERVLPPVSEIVFRHQQAQAAQDNRLHTFVAHARIENHFRPNATDSGFDVVTENRFFSDDEGSEWEETSFTLNGSKWGKDRPPFPLLQPEKVLSLPLDLRLTRDYRYRLAGVERVGDHECYVVRFDPLAEGQSLYRGTVWIDIKTFVKVKVQAVQTRLSAPVVSNEEVQYFTPEATVDGLPLYLLSRFTSRQIMLVAGRNLLVERLVQFSGFEINAPDFRERRASARNSDNIMYRDTDQGLRHFVKRDGERVVQERAVTSAKALAAGVTVDPSFDYPLPILGINYLDFEFLGKDSQLALLFGGILALANVQKPRAVGGKVDASLDLFAIAVPLNDQVFDSAGELRGQRLRTLPFSTGVNLGYQLTSFQKLLGSYQFRFDAYSTDDEADPGFVAPSDTVTNGFGLGYEYRRAGYSLVLGGAYYRRAQWEPWGTGEDYSPEDRTYWKYTASLSKDFFLHTVHKVHLNLAYFGGQRLDRFSMYQFGMFDDNKVRGVPSAGVRFAELAMFRGGYSLNLFELYRLDLFLDQAWGRGAEAGSPRESITGVGLGLNFRTPWGTMFRGEVGKSFLPERYRGSGSWVGQVLILKPF
jgi:hypothetical protein